MRPAKIQISLRMRAVWSEFSLDVFWVAEDAKFLNAANEDSAQTAQIHMTIFVLFGCTCQYVRFLKY